MEWLFWFLGEDTLRATAYVLYGVSAVLALSAVVLIIARLFDSIAQGSIGAVLLLAAGGFLLIGLQAAGYMPPSAQEQTYVSEEHQLTSVGNLREQESTTSTYSGILTYASTTTVDNVEIIRFIHRLSVKTPSVRAGMKRDITHYHDRM